MKVLFARIGHMKFYQGPQKGDERPIGGGSYNVDELGHEAYNFKEVDGKLYGYFQPHMKEPYHLNLKRIDPSTETDQVEDVLVVFFAKNLVGTGQVIVGWYKNATVHKEILRPENQPQRDNFGYNIVAEKSDSVLLPMSKRRYLIGHGIEGVKAGNPGQANAFYAYDDKFKKKESSELNSWIDDAIEYVNTYEGGKIDSFEDEIHEEIDHSAFMGGGQGFQSNIVIKRLIEQHAMDMCKEHFIAKGYTVTDTSLNKPYDYIASKGKEKLFIEVKGTQTLGEKIILTKNEVEMSKKYGDQMVLFLVHSIEMNKKRTKKNSGKVVIKSPWKLNESRLVPISYAYTIS